MATTQQLLFAHKYAEAVELAKQEYAQLWPTEDWTQASLARAHFVNGDYANSIPLYIEVSAGARASRFTPGNPGCEEEISVAHWCLGHRDEAIVLMKGLCAGILSNKIKYSSDGAGGGNQGLLLHYMATTIKDEALRQYALTYLEKVMARKVKELGREKAFEFCWPIPLMAFVLGDAPYSAVMKGATNSNFHKEPPREELGAALEMAKRDLMTRRRFTNLLLQEATLARASGDETGCMAKMRQCYEMENPIIENSWYLARYEVTGK
jgi:hypothetical protein